MNVGSRESNPDGGNLSAHITSVLTDGSEENEKITNRVIQNIYNQSGRNRNRTETALNKVAVATAKQ